MEIRQFLFHYKKNIFFLMLFSLIEASASYIIPFIVRSLLQNVELRHFPVNYVMLFMFILVGMYLCTIFYRILLLKFSLKFKCETLIQFFKKLFSVRLPFIHKKGPTYYTERILNATDKIFAFISDSASAVSVSIISMMIALTIIFFLNKVLFIFFTLLIPINFLSYRRLNFQLQTKCSELQQVSATNLKNVINMVQNVEAIKQNTNYQSFLRMLDKYITNWQKKTYDVSMYGMLFSATINFLTECIKNGVLFLTCYYFLSNKILFADLIFVNLIFSVYFEAINSLNRLNINFRDVKAGLSFIKDEVETLMEKEDEGEALHKIETISFNIKKFRYAPDRDILKDINVEFRMGDKIGLVGRIGSGKSTIIKLLMRFYDEFEEIKINNKNIKKYSLRSLRRNIYVVSQTPFLFPGTVRENITIGLEHVDENRFHSVVSLPFLSTFLKELPQGLDTEIGEGSFNLSGGQKQMIMVARSLMHNPSLIVFDESTASMDSRIEEQIYFEISSFLKAKIVIKISHRLSTLKDCNKIIVIKNGRINGIGSHEELVRVSDEYRKLFSRQLLSSKEG